MVEQTADLRTKLADVIGPMLAPTSGLCAGLVGRATRKRAQAIADAALAYIHGEGLSLCRSGPAHFDMTKVEGDGT